MPGGDLERSKAGRAAAGVVEMDRPFGHGQRFFVETYLYEHRNVGFFVVDERRNDVRFAFVVDTLFDSPTKSLLSVSNSA